MAMRVNLIEPADMDKYYESAQRMEIVGLACKKLLANLCPSYGDPWPAVGDESSAELRLAKLKNSALFAALKGGLEIQAFMLSPYCNYAKARSQEEFAFNRDCRRDLFRGLAALSVLESDLSRVWGQEPWRLQGEIAVSLLKDNPCVTYTHIQQRDGQPHFFHIGYILHGRQGRDTPRVVIEGHAKEIQSRVAPFISHIEQMAPDPLFSWGRQGSPKLHQEFRSGGFDVFLCHNSRDRQEVQQIEDGLNQRGIACWRDRSTLVGGDDWERKIRAAIRELSCAAVFLGRYGLGGWQAVELQLLLNREKEGNFKIIPVVLKDVEIPSEDMGPLSRLNRIEIKHSLDELEQIVRQANRL